MNTITLPVIPATSKTREKLLDHPAISIIMPFEPKMFPKSAVVDQLKSATELVHRQLANQYKNDLTIFVIQKLRRVLRNLNFSTYCKSIAIYVSPLVEKVLYVDMEVEPKVTIGMSLDIRSLVEAKKEQRRYLVMYMNEYSSNIYLGNGQVVTKLKSNIPYSESCDINGKPESGGTSNRLERISECSDVGLSAILRAYPLPVFVVGPQKAVNFFQQNSPGNKNVLEYISTGGEIRTESHLAEIMTPVVNDWESVKIKYLRQQLEVALVMKTLATGIGNVLKMSSRWTGSLLLVEKNYSEPTELLECEDGLYTLKEPYSKYSHLHNAVDCIIENVLNNGGDVQFVEKGFLKSVKEIALIR